MQKTTKKQKAPVSELTRYKKNRLQETTEAHHSNLHGLHLEHFWQNEDDPNKVIFLLSTSDRIIAKQLIKNNLLFR